MFNLNGTYKNQDILIELVKKLPICLDIII